MAKAPPGARRLTWEQFQADLRHQAQAWEPTKRKRFLRKVIGHVMQSQVIVRFLRGGYQQSGDWKSTASGAKKYSGRWSADYNVRPSGNEVSADKIRMVDTGDLAEDYDILDYSADHVTIGPEGRKHDGASGAIAEAQENAGNNIVGFTQETIQAMDAEVQNYLDKIADGHEPPYLPKSRLGKRGATNLSGGMA